MTDTDDEIKWFDINNNLNYGDERISVMKTMQLQYPFTENGFKKILCVYL